MPNKQNAPLGTGRETQYSFEFHSNYTTLDAVTQFKQAMANAGLAPPNNVISDGEFHRFPTNNRASDNAGWYVLSIEDIPAGSFGDFRTDIKEYWRGDIGRALSPIEKQFHEQKLEDIRKKTAHEKIASQEEAQRTAESIWMKAVPALANHPYLTAKRVQSHNLKLDENKLVVPMSIGNTLHSLQLISTDGNKRFLKGGRKKGCYHLIGNPSEVLCVAEGYATAASIHEASGHAVAIAFDAGNLKPVGAELASRYPDSVLVFCADNDRETKDNPGFAKAKSAAKAVGGVVVLPKFPNGTPGTDFNDLCQSSGPDAVRAAINSALVWSPPEPIFYADERKRYPIEALPPIIRDAVEEVAAFVQAPLPMIATSAFGALSLCIQGLADVRRADTLTGPTSLFTLTIAESGERKSTVDNYFTKGVRTYEEEQGEALYPEVKARKTRFDIWKAKRQGLLRKIASETRQGNPTGEIEGQLSELEREKPSAVKVPHLVRTDETPEHLAIALRDEWPSGGIVSSEAGTVFGSHAMNPESIMRNLSQFNVLWDGGELQYGRVTRESFRLRNVRLSVSLQVQPGALKEFLDKHGALARGNGFLARFLITWPESTQGSRLMADAPDNWPGLSAFDLRVRELLNTPLQFTHEGGIKPFLLNLNPEAARVWRRCHDDVELQLSPGQPLSEIKDAASKVADNVARMATLMHVFQYGPNGAVGPESVSAAFDVVSWHINETKRFLGEFSLPEPLSKAAVLDDWLLQRCRSKQITKISKREIGQCGPNALRRRKELDEALKTLEELDRIRLEKSGPTLVVRLHPNLLEDRTGVTQSLSSCNGN